MEEKITAYTLSCLVYYFSHSYNSIWIRTKFLQSYITYLFSSSKSSYYDLFISPSLTLQQLLISSRNLEFFTSGYRYLIQILPAAVVAPMYFSGKIEFGVINQSVSAFNHILGDFSLIVYQFQAISAFSAVIDRLGILSALWETCSVCLEYVEVK